MLCARLCHIALQSVGASETAMVEKFVKLFGRLLILV